jgi:ferredoxin--NADP+ reductase
VSSDGSCSHLAAVVGAGPAGLFAARYLANQGVHVVLFNRDIKPGGLAEYGIYPDKVVMRAGLCKQFSQILASPLIDYYGNVTIGNQQPLTLPHLRALGFQAILVTVGAQGTKWLGLPGENLRGVYHAKDLVYYYNRLPPFSTRQFAIGRRVALVGVGNVMIDIARWVTRELKVDEVIAVARRGPAEVKFTKKEMGYVAANLDLPALDAEFERLAPVMVAIGQDVTAAKDFILSGLPKALEPVSATRVRFQFLASPKRIVGDENGAVRGLEVEDTTLVVSAGVVQTKSLGTMRMLDVDTVLFCIGDRVDDTFGLPVRRNEFVKHPQPCYPVDGHSYEAYDPDLDRPVDRIFFAGWSREASHGLVGMARKDGENGARAIGQYFQTQPPLLHYSELSAAIEHRIRQLPEPVVTKADLERLAKAEVAEAARRGLASFKFATNEEMLREMGLLPVRSVE